MKLFRRTDTTQQVPAELQPYYDQNSGWKLWVRRAVYALVALLILFAIGWAAWAVYNSVTDDGAEDKPNTPIGQSDDKSKNNSNNDTTNPKSDNKSDNKTDTQSDKNKDSSSTTDKTAQLPSGSTDQSDSSKETSSAATTTPNNIPKTGPADVAAVAIGASILGAIFHRLFLSRRQIRQ